MGITVIYHSKIEAWERRHSYKYSCQLEIDHVTQQPKETCQRTCRGPDSFDFAFAFMGSAKLDLSPSLF